MPLSPAIQAFIAQFGNTWNPSVNSACEQFFESRHAALHQPPIPTVRVETDIKYEEDERQTLDITWPTNIGLEEQEGVEEEKGLPVVVFFHGGAFVRADTQITPHMHANIGVLGTYRLLPEARYPDGTEDVAATLTWIHRNIHRYGGNPDAAFALGQSAGGAHLAMALFLGLIEPQDQPRGTLLLSAALAYDLTKEDRRKNMEMYYNTTDHGFIQAHSALGLFENAPMNVLEGLRSKVFVAIAEWDFPECVQGNLRFVEAFARRMDSVPKMETLMGHNHVSYFMSIGLEGNDVGVSILKWMRRSLEG